MIWCLAATGVFGTGVMEGAIHVCVAKLFTVETTTICGVGDGLDGYFFIGSVTSLGQAHAQSSVSTLNPIASLDVSRYLSDGGVAFESDTVQQSLISVVVVNRIVQDAAIIPEGNRAWLPAKAAGELNFGLVRK